MASQDEERRRSFAERLRSDTKVGPGRGIRRFARMVRSGAGLAGKALLSSRRDPEAPLSERDLESLEALVTRLGELKGLPMKFGQIMSYLELEMPEEGRRLLGLLQTQAPATPYERVAVVVREDLGAAGDELLARIDRVPVSVASIGQVYRGTLADGAAVAVKVRHPDIEEAIRSDFRVARKGTGLAGMLVPGMGATARDFVAEIEARLLEECDYALEADRQERFASIYAGHAAVVVPAVWRAFCGRRVLTTSWETGQDFETFRAAATQPERDHAGATLFDFYLGTLYRHGLFHADPHPGNYAFRDDGRVVVFDYGCVRVFEADVARAFRELAEAVRADDRARVCAALEGLGAAPSSDDAAYAHVRRLLRSFFAPMLVPGARRVDGRLVVDLGQITRDKLALAKLRLPGRLMFLLRLQFGLWAVLSRLGSVCDWAALERRFAAEEAIGPGRPDPR